MIINSVLGVRMDGWVLCGTVFYDVKNHTLSRIDGSISSISLNIREVLLLDALLRGETDKRALIDSVWPATVVSDSSYHKLLFELRTNLQAIGLPASTIKTIPRRGCRLSISALAVTNEDIVRQPRDTSHKDLPDCESTFNNKNNLGGMDNVGNVESSEFQAPILEKIECATPLSESDLLCPTTEKLDSLEHNTFTLFNVIKVLCCCVTAALLSLAVYRSMFLSDGFSINISHIANNNGKKLYSMNESAIVWSDELVNKPFSFGFHYVSSDASSYFLCNKTKVLKCENYIFLQH